MTIQQGVTLQRSVFASSFKQARTGASARRFNAFRRFSAFALARLKSKLAPAGPSARASSVQPCAVCEVCAIRNCAESEQTGKRKRTAWARYEKSPRGQARASLPSSMKPADHQARQHIVEIGRSRVLWWAHVMFEIARARGKHAAYLVSLARVVTCQIDRSPRNSRKRNLRNIGCRLAPVPGGECLVAVPYRSASRWH